MVWVPGGTFQMGSDHHYAEEAPARPVKVDGFWMDARPVTNREFARFIEATGWVTFAERKPDPADYPGVPHHLLKPMSVVFQMTRGPVPLNNPGNWWGLMDGACWNRPLGPGSSITGLDDHPVVHVCWHDVEAYAKWAGADLPTEAEWEFAAWGGHSGTEFVWGSELVPGGKHFANTWQGRFPYENSKDDGWVRTSPVASYPANGYGLFDMIGNVWELTQDWWSTPGPVTSPCCAPSNPRGGAESASYDPLTPDIPIPRKVMKGGSHLCAPSYCRRYRPPARHAQAVDTATSHMGFRCIIRPGTAG